MQNAVLGTGAVGGEGWERADKSCKALVQCKGWDDSIAVGARGGAASLLTPLGWSVLEGQVGCEHSRWSS